MISISVIVPVYNVEKYLHRCVDSILAQTFTDFELILVDDGSPDNCGAVCDAYAEKDGRVRAIHKPNGGVSSARNAGIEIASGEYITFVDSDDYVMPNYLAEMMQTSVDLLCQSALVVDESGNVLSTAKRMAFYTEDCTRQDLIEALLNNAFNLTVSKRYRRDLVQNKISFREDLDFAEDTLFAIEYAMNIRSLKVEQRANYCYVKYDTHDSLSGHYTIERMDTLKKANRLICQALELSGEEARRVFLLRMGDPYRSFLCQNVQYRHPHRSIRALKSLAADEDFIAVLDQGLPMPLSPDLRKAVQRKNKVGITVASYIGFSKECIKRILKKTPLYPALKKLQQKRYYRKENIDRSFPCTSGVNTEEKRNPRVIVSLTSFPERIPYVDKAIRSVMHQTYKPDEIVLWLAEPQFPHREADLPEKLKRLCQYGLQIRWVKEDTRSYKKLIPALEQYPDDIIVTMDDDVYFPRDWLGKLMASLKAHPDEVQCHMITRIGKSGNAYDKVERDRAFVDTASFCNKLLGAGGVAYPPHCLDEEIFNQAAWCRLAPTSDDIWFWGMALKHSTKIRWVDQPMPQLYYVEGTQENTPTLWSVNDKGERLFFQHLNAVIHEYRLGDFLNNDIENEN